MSLRSSQAVLHAALARADPADALYRRRIPGRENCVVCVGGHAAARPARAARPGEGDEGLEGHRELPAAGRGEIAALVLGRPVGEPRHQLAGELLAVTGLKRSVTAPDRPTNRRIGRAGRDRSHQGAAHSRTTWLGALTLAQRIAELAQQCQVAACQFIRGRVLPVTRRNHAVRGDPAAAEHCYAVGHEHSLVEAGHPAAEPGISLGRSGACLHPTPQTARP